ncbi:MAG: hypothetical protein ACP5NE_03190 [Candidatus Micrarchaeia archaeon]
MANRELDRSKERGIIKKLDKVFHPISEETLERFEKDIVSGRFDRVDKFIRKEEKRQ